MRKTRKAKIDGFTDTPTEKTDANTRAVFGDLASKARHQSVAPCDDSRCRAPWSFPSTTSSVPSPTRPRCRSITRAAFDSLAAATRSAFAQKTNITTYNLLLHGVKDTEFEICHGDTLTNDWDILRDPAAAGPPKTRVRRRRRQSAWGIPSVEFRMSN
jgi:hypothetical protein